MDQDFVVFHLDRHGSGSQRDGVCQDDSSEFAFLMRPDRDHVAFQLHLARQNDLGDGQVAFNNFLRQPRCIEHERADAELSRGAFLVNDFHSQRDVEADQHRQRTESKKERVVKVS